MSSISLHSASFSNFTDIRTGEKDINNIRIMYKNFFDIVEDDGSVYIIFSVTHANGEKGKWTADLRVIDPTNVTMGQLNAYFGGPACTMVPQGPGDNACHMRRIGMRFVNTNSGKVTDMPVPFNTDVLLSDLLLPGQRLIELDFLFTDKPSVDAFGALSKFLNIQARILIHNEETGEDRIYGLTAIKDLATTTVGEINLHFGPVTRRMYGAKHTPRYDADAPRRLSHKGVIYSPDTLVKDLMETGESCIDFHFVWNNDPEEDPHLDQQRIDEYFDELDFLAEGDQFVEENTEFADFQDHLRHIDDYFDELDFQAEGEQFVFENDYCAERDTYTAHDHAERHDTMGPALAAQAAAIRRHKTAAPVPEIDEDGPSPAFSMCIPRVFPNITEHRIRTIFAKLNFPDIEAIDMVPCEGTNKRTGAKEGYNRVFIHFLPMEEKRLRFDVRLQLCNIFQGSQVKIMYDEPWFWMVSLSRSPRPQRVPEPPYIATC